MNSAGRDFAACFAQIQCWNNMQFVYPYTIGLHDTDAAAIVFSPNLIRICHHAYESLMSEIGYSIGRLLRERPFGLPIAHIEGDFMIPLRCGDKVEIQTRVAHIGDSSFRMEYDLLLPDKKIAAKAATVHVCVELKTYRPAPLPAEFRSALKKYSN